MLKNRITEIRKSKGMPLETLAERSGLSPGYISLMASGNRNISLKNLEKLASALGCDPADLIGTDDATNNDVLNLWAAIPAERRHLALQVLQSFTTDATSEVDGDKMPVGTNKKRPNRNRK